LLRGTGEQIESLKLAAHNHARHSQDESIDFLDLAGVTVDFSKRFAGIITLDDKLVKADDVDKHLSDNWKSNSRGSSSKLKPEDDW
jgi:hypothetical protein